MLPSRTTDAPLGRVRTTVALGAAVLTLALPLSGSRAAAQDVRAGSLTISHAWVRATLGRSTMAAGYFTVTNNGDAPDRLVSATTGVGAHVAPHETATANGVTTMRDLPDGVPVPAHGNAVFKPGGDHLMIEGLTRALKAGERFPATLTFEKAGTVPVTFSVEAVGARAPDVSMPGMKMN